jgi:hypothetical protein
VTLSVSKTAFWFCLCIAGLGMNAGAQTLRLRTDRGLHEKVNAWPVAFRYGVSTDYADSRSPRAYNHSLGLGFSHILSENWSVGVDAGITAPLVGGKIEKDQQETYAETLNPSTSFGLDYSHPFFTRHSYSLSLGVEPLWDEPSRREGYKGVVGLNAGVTFSLFDKMYSMSHNLGWSSLINTFPYDSEGSPNPDYFVTYKFTNSLRFLKTWKLSYSFGVKMTKYLDSFVGYSYSNSYGISKSFRQLSLGISYENGGFTEDGDVGLWFIDEYRRMFRLSASYSF